MRHASVRIVQRGGVRIHVTAFAPQPDDVELERTSFSLTDSLVEGPESFAVFRRDDIVNALAHHFFGAVGSHHAQAGGVHVQHCAVARD